MKPATLALITVAIIVLIGGALFFLSDPENSEKDSRVESTESSQAQLAQAPSEDGVATAEEEPITGQFTAQEIASHNTEDDCWTIINGSVYDLTSYIPRHQGGDEILRACGQNGTSLFTQRTTSSGEEVGSGTPHSSSAQSQLNSLKIGELSN